MRPAPVRRLTAAAGLVALVPVALMLIAGSLTPWEAALRAGAVLAAVLVVTWVLGGALRLMAGSLEYDARRRQRAAQEAGGAHRGTAGQLAPEGSTAGSGTGSETGSETDGD